MKREAEREADVPEHCACIRMNNKDDGEEEEFSTLYCWQTVREGSDETIPVDQFPLRRSFCGFFPVGVDFSPYAPERVSSLIVKSIRLVVSLCGLMEHSDQDAGFEAFTQCVHPALPNRDLETIRNFLNKTLMCHASYSTIRRIPVDEEHVDKMMVVYPTILSPEVEEIHKSFSLTFRELGLSDAFFFRGAGGSGAEPLNTYPVVHAGFTDSGDIVGVYAVRVDT